jgi:anti-sigma regulatory factor (Ser/Thr protein kinase)
MQLVTLRLKETPGGNRHAPEVPGPRLPAGADAGLLMSGAWPPRSLALQGTDDAPGKARDFVASVLVPARCPALEATALAVSELVTNSVRHSRSRGPRGRIGVRVTLAPGDSVLVEVTDQGTGAAAPPSGPQEMPAVAGVETEALPEGGMGLALIDFLALKWDCETSDAGTTYWALLPWSD